jgi:hypothetical protein
MRKKMNCKLCAKPIKNYDARFHHLKIDESHEIDICSDCTDKIVLWQGQIIGNLFPTKAMKKRYSKTR